MDLRYRCGGHYCPVCVLRGDLGHISGGTGQIVVFSPFYLGYIHSPAWRERRKRALQLAGYRCQVCADKGRLEVHHNNYDNLGHELDADLVVLCWWCHRWHEFGKKLRRFWTWLWEE